MIVTTARRPKKTMEDLAKQISSDYKLCYIERNNYSIKRLLTQYEENVLMVGSEKIELYTSKGILKYHPNFAQVRIRRLLKGENDAFIEATNLQEGASIIDCTMGMLSDALIASFVVGETGTVTSLEAICDIHIAVSIGALKYRHTILGMDEAIRRIKVVHSHALKYLKKQENNSVDVVYFDPMFEETIKSSSGIQSLEKLAMHSKMTKEIIDEAYRVAKERVVLKAHFRSTMFKTFGFMRCVRTSSVSHFGVIIKK